MNFPQAIASAIRTAMFNEHQRLSGTAGPEYIMPSLFAAGIDRLIEAGYTITPPEGDTPPPVHIPLSQVKGHHAQLVKALKHQTDGEVVLSSHHASALATVLGNVVELLRTLPGRRK